MQQEICPTMTPNSRRMSQNTRISDLFLSKAYSPMFFHSDHLHNSPTPYTDISTDRSSTATAITSLPRLISEHRDLLNRYSYCVSQLQKTLKEAKTLREENTNLRVANHDLNQQMTLLLDAAALQVGGLFSCEKNMTEYTSESPTSMTEKETTEKEVEEGRVSLPKSISVRSNDYLKVSPGSSEVQLKPKYGSSSRTQSGSPVSGGPQKVYVSGGNKKEGGIEVDVFNQGMIKTELCNKWQETGDCPYGDRCQFAHGIKELRPVLRHPRYKTEVCRMVLAGDPCPYGHRCHFRHSLTPEEHAMLPLRLE